MFARKGGRSASKKKNAGFTLIELMLVGGALLIAAALLTWMVQSQVFASRGRAEGERVVNALNCATNKARSMGSLGSVTMALLLNNGCFGKDERISDPGATTASLSTTLVRTSLYSQGTCSLMTPNQDDGIWLQTYAQNDDCTDLVDAAARRGAERILVTPNGGASVTVKEIGSSVDLGAAGLTTACRGAQPIAIRVCNRM